jgi:hypothetical protein
MIDVAFHSSPSLYLPCCSQVAKAKSGGLGEALAEAAAAAAVAAAAATTGAVLPGAVVPSPGPGAMPTLPNVAASPTGEELAVADGLQVGCSRGKLCCHGRLPCRWAAGCVGATCLGTDHCCTVSSCAQSSAVLAACVALPSLPSRTARMRAGSCAARTREWTHVHDLHACPAQDHEHDFLDVENLLEAYEIVVDSTFQTLMSIGAFAAEALPCPVSVRLPLPLS